MVLCAAAGRRTVEIGRSHKGNVDTKVAMVGGTIEAKVDAEGNRCPGGILCAAVEADLSPEELAWRVCTLQRSTCLVRLLRLELLKDLLRLLLCRESRHLGWVFRYDPTDVVLDF